MKKESDSGEKTKIGGGGKLMLEILATNVVACWPLEWGPTATPTAHANFGYLQKMLNISHFFLFFHKSVNNLGF